MNNLTDYPEEKIELETSYDAQNEKDSEKDNIKITINKLKPYIVRILKAKKKIMIINFIFFLLLTTYLVFVASPYYVSSITILPEYGGKSTSFGQLGEIAAMAGVKVGESTPTEIYENLILSEAILWDVICAKYKTVKFNKPVNLIEYYEIEKDDELPDSLAKRKSFLKLYDRFSKQLIKTELERSTRILTLTVEAPESKLSADITNEIAQSLDNYIRTKRKSFATEQCYYLEKRTKQVFDSLTIAENKLKNFREQNRIVLQSPTLLLEQARLLRTVEILQTVNIELTKQMELARLDEIKDEPVLNIRETAKEPIIKTGPKRAKILGIAVFISIICTTAYFMFEENIKKVQNQLKNIVREINQ